MTSAMFAVAAEDGQARCGTLATPHGTLATPCTLVYTLRGSALNLTTPDMLEKLKTEPLGLQLDALHL